MGTTGRTTRSVNSLKTCRNLPTQFSLRFVSVRLPIRKNDLSLSRVFSFTGTLGTFGDDGHNGADCDDEAHNYFCRCPPHGPFARHVFGQSRCIA